jgi:nucleotide-binding universal stress UspA family protein
MSPRRQPSAMFDTVVIATDGSASGARAVETALDLADRFGADVHALYVLDSGRVDSLPEDLRDDVRRALETQGTEALETVAERADHEVVTELRVGRPAHEICSYAREVDADMVATGTRGRDGEHSFLLGSVAESVVRICPVPVLTVRQLEA